MVSKRGQSKLGRQISTRNPELKEPRDVKKVANMKKIIKSVDEEEDTEEEEEESNEEDSEDDFEKQSSSSSEEDSGIIVIMVIPVELEIKNIDRIHN